MERKYDLEDRLVLFAANVIKFCNTVPNDFAGTHLKGQLIRSSCSPALNYGEAQSAESKKDFIHKMSISLKELKESRTSIKILDKIQYGDSEKRILIFKECEELTAIFASIINNTKRNMQKP
ncbi:MAG TPA: four helix bundle protein [Anditalea sp.]|nr:four helix bundle protein [Anditalea sp.]